MLSSLDCKQTLHSPPGIEPPGRRPAGRIASPAARLGSAHLARSRVKLGDGGLGGHQQGADVGPHGHTLRAARSPELGAAEALQQLQIPHCGLTVYLSKARARTHLTHITTLQAEGGMSFVVGKLTATDNQKHSFSRMLCSSLFFYRRFVTGAVKHEQKNTFGTTAIF